MGELTGVTDGPGLLVVLLDVRRSKFWPLAERLWSLQEDRDDIVGAMIIESKKVFLDDVNRPETAWDSDVNAKAKAKRAIVNMVGIEIVTAAQLARLQFNEASYASVIAKAEADVASAVLNLKIQRSPATIVPIQPQMLDPDSDYPYDNTGG